MRNENSEQVTGNTKAQADHAAWLDERKTYIGGTDAAAIVGENPRKTALMVWRDKKGLVEDFDNAKMRYGREREGHVIRRYMEQTGHKVRRCSMFRRPGTPYFGANPDGLVLVHRGVLECKTGINRPGTRYEWGRPGTDEVPRHYLIQGVWYLGVTGRPFVDFAFEDRETCETSVYRVFRDEEYEQMLFDACENFWVRHVVGDLEPVATEGDLEDISKALPRDSGISIAATEQIESLVYAMCREKARANKIYTQVKDMEAQIKLFMGEAAILMGTWGKPITWKNDKDSAEIEYEKALTEFRYQAAVQLGDLNHPVLGLLNKLLDEHKVIKVGSRRFTAPKLEAA